VNFGVLAAGQVLALPRRRRGKRAHEWHCNVQSCDFCHVLNSGPQYTTLYCHVLYSIEPGGTCTVCSTVLYQKGASSDSSHTSALPLDASSLVFHRETDVLCSCKPVPFCERRILSLLRCTTGSTRSKVKVEGACTHREQGQPASKHLHLGKWNLAGEDELSLLERGASQERATGNNSRPSLVQYCTVPGG